MKNTLILRPPSKTALAPDFGSKLQKYLLYILAEVLSSEPLPNLASKGALQQIGAEKTLLETHLSLLAAPIDLLSKQENTAALTRLCQPLYQRLELLTQAEEVHSLFARLQQDLPEMILQVKALTAHLRFSPLAERVVTSQVELENWYRRCDHVANQLDRLERSGIKIQALENRYVDLIIQVGELQGTLDRHWIAVA
jgi:hypothetical protein